MGPVPRFDRVSGEDLISLVGDAGSVPMQVGAVLFLRAGNDPDPVHLMGALRQRLMDVPRLRQRLLRVPPGCGRPVWVEDAGFDAARHLGAVPCPRPGGQTEVLKVAAEALADPLPGDRPLWRGVLLTGVDIGGRQGEDGPERSGAAFVFVFHHVLADGIGALAVLDALTAAEPRGDRRAAAPALFPGTPQRHGEPETQPLPTWRNLAADAAATRLRSMARIPSALRRLASAGAELRLGAGAARAARSSLNRPTGPRRQVEVVRCGLAAVRCAAAAQGATVNDAVLAAVGASLHHLLSGRGEYIDRFVLSMPVSARQHATAGELGNRSGAVPVAVPGVGDRRRRLAAVAESTRNAKSRPPGASSALLGPAFRLLARAGLFRWFIDHQRLVHSFTTNVRGPERPVVLGGCRVEDIVPLGAATGNITVAFAVLSYAGTLVVSIMADPDRCPDLAVLRRALDDELRGLAGTAHRILPTQPAHRTPPSAGPRPVPARARPRPGAPRRSP